MSTESHQKILRDYEDLIASLNITSSIKLSKSQEFITNQYGLRMFRMLLFLVIIYMVFWCDWGKLIYIEVSFVFLCNKRPIFHHVTDSVWKRSPTILRVNQLYFNKTFPMLRNKPTFFTRNYLQPVTKYLGLTLVFVWRVALREKFNFCFLLALTKFSIWRGDWALGYHSM